MKAGWFGSIADVLKSRIKTPLVWGVLLLTLALTVLFYFSQKQQAEVYTRYIESLSDYKFLEVRLMRTLEQVRVRPLVDQSGLMSALMSLRETAVSTSAAAEDSRNMSWMPSEDRFIAFENAVWVWVATVRRYVPARSAWLLEERGLVADLNSWKPSEALPFLVLLDSARLGANVVADSSLLAKLPDSLSTRFSALLSENSEMTLLWNRLDDDAALLRCEDLLQAFRLRSLQDREFKFWIQQIFYLISIVLLLFTLFFVFRSRK
ncbi:MAG: hypothetical protein WCR04_06320 [Fibrobacteraceae bacterium]